MVTLHFLFGLLPFLAAIPPDTLVVCPPVYREALEPWLDYRQSQGHSIQLATPASSQNIQIEIQQAAARGRLRAILLVGDTTRESSQDEPHSGVPTCLVPAEVNVRWGSTRQIPSDIPYSDLNQDGAPDVAIGRIPVDSSSELTTVINKIVAYEETQTHMPPNKRLQVATGIGGFGPMADHVIEATATQLFEQLVPEDYEVTLTRLGSSDRPSDGIIRSQLSSSSLAWIYLGHGTPHGLSFRPKKNPPPEDFSLSHLTGSPLDGPEYGNPLAVLMACYSGACDVEDCFAEELLVQDGGPVAVFAASRLSMPYGNTVLGYELLQGFFVEPSLTLGDIVLGARIRTLVPKPEDSRRESFDQMARGLMPKPVNLETERCEHVAMYHLLGDPLMKLPLNYGRVNVAGRLENDKALPK